jgi:hypothetical protein
VTISDRWTRENIAWASGLFEGEGCISISDKRIALELQMTDEDVVRKVRLVMGVGSVGGPYRDKARPKNKPYWRWTVSSGRQAAATLAAMWSFLGVRRRARAAEALRYFSSQPPWTRNRIHCPKGHPYSEENTYRFSRGTRTCRICSLEQARRYREKKKNKWPLPVTPP